MQTDLIFENQMFSTCFTTGKAHADSSSCTKAVSESAGEMSSVEKDVAATAWPDGRCKLCTWMAVGFAKTGAVTQRAGSTSPSRLRDQLDAKQNSGKGGSPDLASQKDDFQMTSVLCHPKR